MADKSKIIKLPKKARPLDDIALMEFGRRESLLCVDPTRTRVQERDGNVLIELKDATLDDLFSAPEPVRFLLSDLYNHPEKYRAEAILNIVHALKPMVYDTHGATMIPPKKQYAEIIDGFDCVFQLYYSTHQRCTNNVNHLGFDLKYIKFSQNFELDPEHFEKIKGLYAKFKHKDNSGINWRKDVKLAVAVDSILIISENFFNNNYSAILGMEDSTCGCPRLFKDAGGILFGTDTSKEARVLTEEEPRVINVYEDLGRNRRSYRCIAQLQDHSIKLMNLGTNRMYFTITDKERDSTVDKLLGKK